MLYREKYIDFQRYIWKKGGKVTGDDLTELADFWASVTRDLKFFEINQLHSD